MYNNKILVTGCSGLVGSYLIRKLINERFNIVGVDLKEPKRKFGNSFEFLKIDLTKDGEIERLFEKYQFNYVINTFGIKGSPIRAKTQPVDFLYPSLKINTEIINQCAKRDIYLAFISSVGVYAPAEKFVEDDVWNTLPSEHDWFPSWSKRTGEMLLEAYKVQYDYKNWCIIRPANIYGEYDEFSGSGTVISSTIKKIWESNGEIECWGDGSPIRDFVFGDDVAECILHMVQNKIHATVNFGSGEEITIKKMVDYLVEISKKNINVTWDISKPNGDLRRQMDVTRQTELEILPKTSFYDGLKKTYQYYTDLFPKEGLHFVVNDFLNNGYFIGKTIDIIPNEEEFLKQIESTKLKLSKENINYHYRFEYFNADRKPHSPEYRASIKKEEIAERDRIIEENGHEIIQRWGEFSLDIALGDETQYFRKIVEDFIPKIYPDLKDNIYHSDNITLYEDGDFITPHTDGSNPKRYCVILIYLTSSNEYSYGGGKLLLGCGNNVQDSVIPTNENFALIDFTKSETLHAVEPVKNGFKRLTYINFVHNKKMVEEANNL